MLSRKPLSTLLDLPTFDCQMRAPRQEPTQRIPVDLLADLISKCTRAEEVERAGHHMPPPPPGTPERRVARILYALGPVLLLLLLALFSGCAEWFLPKTALRPGELAYEVERGETLSLQLKVVLDHATADPEDGRKALCRRALLLLPCTTVQVVGAPLLKATAKAANKPDDPATETTEVSGTVACGGEEECGGNTPLRPVVSTADVPHA